MYILRLHFLCASLVVLAWSNRQRYGDSEWSLRAESGQSGPESASCSKSALMRAKPAYKCADDADHDQQITCQTIGGGFPPKFGPKTKYRCCNGAPVEGASTCVSKSGGGAKASCNKAALMKADPAYKCETNADHGKQMACRSIGAGFPPKFGPRKDYMCCDGVAVEGTSTCGSTSVPPGVGCKKSALMKDNPAYRCEADADHENQMTCQTVGGGFPPKFGEKKEYRCCDGKAVEGASTCAGSGKEGNTVRKGCKKADAQKTGLLCPGDAVHLGKVSCSIPFPPGPAQEYMCCDGKLQLALKASCASEVSSKKASRAASKRASKTASKKAQPTTASGDIDPEIMAKFERMYKRVFQDSEWSGSKELQLVRMIGKEYTQQHISTAGFEYAMKYFCYGEAYAKAFESQPECEKHKPKAEIPDKIWKTVMLKYKRIFQDSEYSGTKAFQTIRMVEKESAKGIFAIPVRDAIIDRLCTEFADGYDGGKGAFKDELRCKQAAGETKKKAGSSEYLDVFVKDMVNVYVRPPVKKSNPEHQQTHTVEKVENPVSPKELQAMTFYKKNRYLYGEVKRAEFDWEKATHSIIADACSTPCTAPEKELQKHTEWDLDGDGIITMLEAHAMCDACLHFFDDRGRKPLGATGPEAEEWNRNFGPKQAELIKQYMRQLYTTPAGKPMQGAELKKAKVNAGVMGMASALVDLFPLYGKLPQFFEALGLMTTTHSAGLSAWRRAIDVFEKLNNDKLANAYKANCAVMPKLLGLEEALQNSSCSDRIQAVVKERNFKNARCLALQSNEIWKKLGLTDADAKAMADARIAEPEGNTPLPYVKDPAFTITKLDSLRRGAFVQADMDARVGGIDPDFEYKAEKTSTWNDYENDVQEKYGAARSLAADIQSECIDNPEARKEAGSCGSVGQALQKHLAKARTTIGGGTCNDRDDKCIFAALFSAEKFEFRNAALKYMKKFIGPKEHALEETIGVWALLDLVVNVWRNLFDTTVPTVKSSLVRRWIETRSVLKKCGMLERCLKHVSLKKGIDLEIGELEQKSNTASPSDRYQLGLQVQDKEKAKTWIDDTCSNTEAKGGVSLCAAIDLRMVKPGGPFPPKNDDEGYGRGVTSTESVPTIWCKPTMENLQEAALYALELSSFTDAKSLVFAWKEKPNKYKTITDANATELADFRESGMEFWVKGPANWKKKAAKTLLSSRGSKGSKEPAKKTSVGSKKRISKGTKPGIKKSATKPKAKPGSKEGSRRRRLR